jgi:hypothetical protein
MRWDAFERACPEIARIARERFAADELVLVGTVRADGSARISPNEPDFAAGRLFVSMMWRSRKALDLLRDPRIAIHGPTADPPEEAKEWAGEAKLAGRAIEVSGDEPEPEAHSFRIDVEEIVLTHLNDAGDRLVIESWHPGRGIEVVERE